MTKDRMAAEQAAEARIVAWLREHGVDADASADDAVPALGAALARADMRSDALLDDLCLTAHALRRVEQENERLRECLDEVCDSVKCAPDEVCESVQSVVWQAERAERESAALRAQVEALREAREALKKLRLEVGGALAIGSHGIRETIGNTNYECLKVRVAEADAALTRTEDR